MNDRQRFAAYWESLKFRRAYIMDSPEVRFSKADIANAEYALDAFYPLGGYVSVAGYFYPIKDDWRKDPRTKRFEDSLTKVEKALYSINQE